MTLVRSGRTLWDQEGRVQGQTDLPLSEPGRTSIQAALKPLVESGEDSRPATIYTAPDEASRETARWLSDQLDARLRVIDELTTMKLGLWEGLLETEIEDRYPSVSRLWREQPSMIHPPEGETFPDAENRIRSALCELFEKSPSRPIAVVLRPMPYAMASCWLSGRPASDVWSVIEDGPFFQSFSVARAFVLEAIESLKAKA